MQKNDKLRRRNLLALLAAPLIACLGCGTLKPLQFSDPNGVGSDSLVASVDVKESETVQMSLRDDSDQVASIDQRRSNPGVVSGVVPVSYEESNQDFALASYPIEGNMQVCSSSCSNDCQGTCGICNPPTAPAAPKNVQEYIFDGGDQQLSVVVQKDWSVAGLDPTDTVIYYETLGGQVCVKPSNRVPIYAPRFGAVRKITGAVLAARAVGTERILAPVAPARLDETNLAGTVMQPMAPQGEQLVRVLDAFQENQLGTPMAGVVPPQRMSEAIVLFEGIDIRRTGKITDQEIAVLGRVLENARTWFTPESLNVLIEGQQASVILDTKIAQDVFVYEMPDNCAMRLCKTASHTIANSGDTVRFTLRFDNAGVKPLGNAVIMDSLSPRLEYIIGSQQSSIDAQFSTEPNDAGSVTLRWEILSPIKASDGGSISFDCRVR